MSKVKPRERLDELKIELQNLGNIKDSTIIVKLGSRDYPASCDEMHKMTEYLNSLAQNLYPNHKGIKFIITHHAVTFEKLDIKEGDHILVKIGDAERPAGQEDIDDMKSLMDGFTKPLGVESLITHHAVDICDKQFSETFIARIKQLEISDESNGRLGEEN